VCAIANLHTDQDAKFLLNTLDLDRDELNPAAHEIDVRSAIDLILWMRKESTNYIAQTIGWPITSITPKCIDVFCTAVKALLPPVCFFVSPRQAMEKHGNVSLKRYVWDNRSYKYVARELRKRAQAWGVWLLSEKETAFIKSAQRQGHCVSSKNLNNLDNRVDNKVASMDSKVASTGKEVASMGNKVASMGKEVASMDNKVASMNNKVASMGKEVASMGKEMASMVNSINQLLTLWKMKHPEDADYLARVLVHEVGEEQQ